MWLTWVICFGVWCCLTLIGLQAWFLWRQHRWLLRSLEQVFERQTDLSREFAEAVVDLETRVLDVRRQERQAEQERLEALPIGTFVPDDQTASEIEKTIRSAEDRFIHAGQATRFSSQHSRSSVPRSGRGPSTPPERPSGRV